MSLHSSSLPGANLGGPSDLNKYVGNGTSIEQLRGQQNQHMGPGPGGPPPPPPVIQQQYQQQQEQQQQYQQQQEQHPQEDYYHQIPYHMQQQQQVQQAKVTKKNSISSACIPYTNVEWVVFISMIFLFILLSNASIYKLESQFVPIQFLSNDDPPIVLVIFNAMLFGIIFLVVKKLVN